MRRTPFPAIRSDRNRRLGVAVAVAVLLVAAGLVGLASADDPDATVTKAEAGTAVPNGTVTVTVEATNASEVDVTNVPEGWAVHSHRDDFGEYVNQLDGEDRVVWLWSWTVSSNVSVTFSVPPNASAGTHDLTVVPYAGTTRGQAKTVTVTVRRAGAAQYANANGVITTRGLRSAVTDWTEGEIGLGLLREVIRAWVDGTPVA